MSGDVGFAAAFAAGLVSFVSPCVLPMVPGYLSFLAGLSASGSGEGAKRRTVVTGAALFVLGFTVVFVALGSAASLVGSISLSDRALLERVAGIVLVCFGVLMLGVVKLPWLYGEARFDPARARGLGRWAPPVVGAAFAFGWTPCVGPILGTILMLAHASESVGRGAALLFVYSLGLGVPFLLAAYFLASAGPVLRLLQRHAVMVQRVAGGVLIVFGLLMATGMLAQLTGVLMRYIPLVGL